MPVTLRSNTWLTVPFKNNKKCFCTNIKLWFDEAGLSVTIKLFSLHVITPVYPFVNLRFSVSATFSFRPNVLYTSSCRQDMVFLSCPSHFPNGYLATCSEIATVVRLCQFQLVFSHFQVHILSQSTLSYTGRYTGFLCVYFVL